MEKVSSKKEKQTATSALVVCIDVAA